MAASNIDHNLRIRIQRRINKPNTVLARLESLRIKERNSASEDRRRRRRPVNPRDNTAALCINDVRPQG